MRLSLSVHRVATCLLAAWLVTGCDKSPTTSDHIAGPRFAAVGPVSQLVFTVQPSSAAAGAAITPAVQVAAQDAQGNTVTTYTAKITVTLGTNPTSAKLGGTVIVSAKSGVATFSNLSITNAATGYALRATSGTLTAATSSPFDITPGPASKIMFTVQPTPTAAGDPITPAVTVSAEDAFNNVATTYSGSVSLALRSCPAGALLTGTATVATVGGVATFGDLSINKSGNCGLTATSGSFTAKSVTFVVGPAAPVSLQFTAQPSKTKAGVAINPAVKVTARDQFGNTASGFNGQVTMSIASGPVGVPLLGTTTVTAVSGTASFANLIIQKVGSYALQASATGLTSATSTGFLVVPNSPTHLAFTVQPSTTAPGAVITPPVQVMVRDAYDNPVPITGSVTLAIGSNPSGGTLSGTLTGSAVATGVATFNDLSINNAGAGYTLVATLGTLPSATSAPFDISGTATQLVFTGQPSTTAAGSTITPSVQVTAQDVQGTKQTSFTGSVTIVIGSNPRGGTLAGTMTVSAVGGVATFSDLSINKAGTGYTLQATSGALTAATSVAFDITPGAVAQLVFTVQPSNTAAGGVITPAVQVTSQDAQGNAVTGFTGDIMLSIGTNPGGGLLSGTTTSAAVAGVATFSDLSINNGGTGYTLVANSSGVPQSSSVPFSITNASDFWTTSSPMPTPRDHLGVAEINGVLYAVGGANNDGLLPTLEAYDPSTNTWSTKTPMPTARQNLRAVAVSGILYAIGGNDVNGNIVAAVEAYDPSSNSWTTKAPMLTPRTVLSAVAIGGIIYAVGGVDVNGNVVGTLEAYDPATDTWATLASMPTAREEMAAAAAAGILYVVGGRNVNQGSPQLSTVEAYDPGTHIWTEKAPMPTPHWALAAGAVNSIVYAVGGIMDNHLVSTLEAYDPVNDMWTTKASMPTAREGMGVSTINDLLYVVGGAGNFNLATIEVYHP